MERKRKLIPLDESQKGVSEMLFAESLPVNSRYDMKLSQIGALGDFIDTNIAAGNDPMFMVIRYAFKLGYMKGHDHGKSGIYWFFFNMMFNPINCFTKTFRI